jgi:hypothetical protein
MSPWRLGIGTSYSTRRGQHEHIENIHWSLRRLRFAPTKSALERWKTLLQVFSLAEPASCWFLAWFICLPWRWRRYVLQKRVLTFNVLHGVISQKSELFNRTLSYAYAYFPLQWSYNNRTETSPVELNVAQVRLQEKILSLTPLDSCHVAKICWNSV